MHSLALVADAFHMLNDILSLVVALWAVRVAKSRGADRKYTYGWQRAEILGALVNGVFLLALCLSIFLEAIQRLIDPPTISNPKLILIVGCCGLASNLLGLVLFHEHGHGHSHGGHGHGEGQAHDSTDFLDDGEIERLLPENAVNDIEGYGSLVAAAGDEHEHEHEHNHDHDHNDDHDHDHSHDSAIDSANTVCNTLSSVPSHRRIVSLSHKDHFHAQPRKARGKTKSMNMEGVFLHVLGDAFGNVGVILTALFIWKTDYSWKYYMDPVISLVITVIIFSSALPLCRRASKILLQGSPQHINVDEVRSDLESLPGVQDIHDLHVWMLKEDVYVSTLHVSVDVDVAEFVNLAEKIRVCLHDYGVQSVTIQPEFVKYCRSSRHGSVAGSRHSSPPPVCASSGAPTNGQCTC